MEELEGITRYGSNFSSPVILQGYPVLTRSGGMWKKESKYLIHRDYLESSIPPHGTMDPEEPEKYLRCTEVEVKHRCEPGFPDVCEVSVTYQQYAADQWGGTSTGGKQVTFSTSTKFEELKIEDHPEYSTLSKPEQEWVKEKCAVYALYTVVVNRNEKRERKSFRLDADAIAGTVGALELPTDFDFDKDVMKGKWKHISHDVTFVDGESVEIADSWQYSYAGWGACLQPGMTLKQYVAALKRQYAARTA